MGLVDELRVMVNPVALGDGKSLFRSSKQELGLKLLQTRTFRSGNVLLTYRPPRRAR
jgi:dihydrofolate reductase